MSTATDTPTATATEPITIENIGPIRNLRIPVPDHGGLVVLRGRNGSGKSHALDAVGSLISGQGKPPVRDKQLRGEVHGFGAKIAVSKTTRRSGELEVVSLEGKLSIADLVDPGLASPDAADAKRIKSLIQLAGADADPALFHKLLGSRDEFDQIVSKSTTETDDPILLASRIKRDIDAAARQVESQVEHAKAHAQACREVATGVDLDDESDGTALQTELEEALKYETDLRTKADEAARSNKALEVAKTELANLEANSRLLTVEAAAEKLQTQLAARDLIDQQLAEAQARVIALKDQLATAATEVAKAIEVHHAAATQEKTLQFLRDYIAASTPQDIPTDDQINRAAVRVRMAREAIEQGALVRKAKLSLVKALEHDSLAKVLAQRAEWLRQAAQGTDDVLSDLVSRLTTDLRVEAGRLVCDTARGATYFSDLSHGERWKLAIDLAVNTFPSDSEHRPVLVIPQEAFEGLDPENRRLIHEHAIARHVTILTAEAGASDQIEAEMFE
jgi:energy-coupling factor transporter ATP-binding protein EcfA2